MIASNSTFPNEPSSHSYGGLFSPNNFQSPRADLPSLGTFLSQGVATGALLGFLWPAVGMLAHPQNGYNFLLIGALPFCLGVGGLLGLCEATTLWAGTYAIGHRIHPLIRTILGPGILYAILYIYGYLFLKPPPQQTEVETAEYWLPIALYAFCGMVLGLAIGSPIRPLFELVRGTVTERWRVMNALTGLVLRPIVILGLMTSTLILILSTQSDFHQSQFAMSVFAVSHFALAVTIVFVRMPFWLLLPLALLTNYPVAALIKEVLGPEALLERIITLSYLGLWGLFLICRASVPSAPFIWIKRNYVITSLTSRCRTEIYID